MCCDPRYRARRTWYSERNRLRAYRWELSQFWVQALLIEKTIFDCWKQWDLYLVGLGDYRWFEVIHITLLSKSWSVRRYVIVNKSFLDSNLQKGHLGHGIKKNRRVTPKKVKGLLNNMIIEVVCRWNRTCTVTCIKYVILCVSEQMITACVVREGELVTWDEGRNTSIYLDIDKGKCIALWWYGNLKIHKTPKHELQSTPSYYENLVE